MLAFRPLPWATALAVPALCVLLALGAWQLARRAEKHAFLAALAERGAAAPAPVERVLGLPDPNYRRVIVDLPADCRRQTFVNAFRIDGGRTVTGAQVVTPGALPDGKAVLVVRGFLPRASILARTGGPEGIPCPSRIQGVAVVTPGEDPALFTPAPDLSRRLWYGYDARGMEAALGLTLAAPVMLRLQAPGQAGTGADPEPLPYAADVPDNHLAYALTWFGLAATLLGVYIAYHTSLGRLRIGR
jgi:surfeit locus 1 family protein